jgi:hypothetical protein
MRITPAHPGDVAKLPALRTEGRQLGFRGLIPISGSGPAPLTGC